MPTMIFTHLPKPGVSFEDFQKYIVEVDMPWNMENPAVIAATIYHIKPVELDVLTHDLIKQPHTENPPPFKSIEIMHVRSYEEFLSQNRPTMERLDEWSKYGDINTARAYLANPIFQSNV